MDEVKEEKKQQSIQEFEAHKFVSKEEKKLRNRVSFLEKQIAELEEKMKAIENILQNPGKEDDVMDLTRDYLELKREMDAKTDEWAEVSEKLESFD